MTGLFSSADITKGELRELEAERDRLREALETILAEYEGHLGTGQMLSDLCREALAGPERRET